LAWFPRSGKRLGLIGARRESRHVERFRLCFLNVENTEKISRRCPVSVSILLAAKLVCKSIRVMDGAERELC
jgi:hypothetical protein